jgi:hypothetical protein
MDQRPPEGLVAAAHLAGDDRRPQHLLGVVVGRRHLGIVQADQPLAAMGPEVAVATIQLRAYRPRQAVEPGVQPVLGLLDAAGVAGGGQCLPAAAQIDGLLQARAQGLQVRPPRSGEDFLKALAAPEQVAVGAALGDFEHVVAVQAIDHQVAIEVGAEDVFGDLMAPGTHAAAERTPFVAYAISATSCRAVSGA